MEAYSEDLRQKVVEAVNQRGTSKSEAARLFGISLSSVKRYTRLAGRGEPLTPRKGGGRPPVADDATRKLLEEDVRTRPSATIEERRRYLESFAGKSISEPTLRRLLKRMGFSRKKDCGGDGTRRWKRRSVTVRADGHQQALETARRREKEPGFAAAYSEEGRH